MKMLNLTKDSRIYTSNVYYVMGSNNNLSDVNTLIDVGRDSKIIKKILAYPGSGVGKHKVDQVILTHGHYDHSSLLPEIKREFSPKVYAFSPYLDGVDHVLKDGESLKIGDEYFTCMYTPGHSNDSICLYNRHSGVLFSGDTTLIITSKNDKFEKPFIDVLKKLVHEQLNVIYPGHGRPVSDNLNHLICNSLKNIRN